LADKKLEVLFLNEELELDFSQLSERKIWEEDVF